MRRLARVRHVLAEEIGDLPIRRTLLLALAGVLPRLAFSRVRAGLVRCSGVAVGSGTVIGGRLVVSGWGGRLSFGRDCFVNSGCHVDLSASVSIGDRVALAHDVLIITSSHTVGPRGQRAAALQRRPVAVGDGAWIGARAILLPGVVVGPGAIVAAGAVVAKDVPAHTLVAGVPARHVRDLGTGDASATDG